MTGTAKSNITITLRNPVKTQDHLCYTIQPFDTAIARDWAVALEEILEKNKQLEKNFCFLGFPNTARSLEYLCQQLNQAIFQINQFNPQWVAAGLAPYIVEEYFCPDSIRFGGDYPVGAVTAVSELQDFPYEPLGLKIKHEIMNRLHNHFERLQGTVDNLSSYYITADHKTKYAIRQLNIICHEIESLVLSQRKAAVDEDWIRPSQITTFLQVDRYELTAEHKKEFVTNGYNRQFGYVYMHWTQIGKTLFEVYRDEDAPDLLNTTCEAITALKYYSGEFDVEWGNDVVYDSAYPWHVQEQDKFRAWLIQNQLNPDNPELSLGYLPVGRVLLEESFGTTDPVAIRKILGEYLDIYQIEVNGIKNRFDYCWSDSNYKEQQIAALRPGYDFSSRG